MKKTDGEKKDKYIDYYVDKEALNAAFRHNIAALDAAQKQLDKERQMSDLVCASLPFEKQIDLMMQAFDATVIVRRHLADYYRKWDPREHLWHGGYVDSTTFVYPKYEDLPTEVRDALYKIRNEIPISAYYVYVQYQSDIWWNIDRKIGGEENDIFGAGAVYGRFYALKNCGDKLFTFYDFKASHELDWKYLEKERKALSDYMSGEAH